MSKRVANVGFDDLPNSISTVLTTPGEYVEKSIVNQDGTLINEWFDLASLGVSAVSLYTGDGTLEEDRTVTGDGNDIVFTGNPLFAVRTTTLIDLDGAVTINESGASVDTRIESNTNANAIFVDASADTVGIMNAAPTSTLDVTGTLAISGAATLGGAVTINESGAAVDVRIETDLQTHAFFVDGSADFIGINNAAPAATLDVVGTVLVLGATGINGALTVNEAGADVNLRVESDTDTVALTVDAGLNAVGVGVALAAHAGKLDVNQNAVAGALPVLNVTQLDTSEEFVRFHGTSAADNTMSLVDAADLAVPGAIVGWLRIYVEDLAVAGSIADGVYFIPFYATPTA